MEAVKKNKKKSRAKPACGNLRTVLANLIVRTGSDVPGLYRWFLRKLYTDMYVRDIEYDVNVLIH